MISRVVCRANMYLIACLFERAYVHSDVLSSSFGTPFDALHTFVVCMIDLRKFNGDCGLVFSTCIKTVSYCEHVLFMIHHPSTMCCT